MDHDEQAPMRGTTNGDETAFTDRVIRIIESCGERIVEYGDSLIE